jgi:pimeloyl-ACP methyl ester carboxylesterase
LVNHVIDFNTTWTASSPSLQFLPFYGHVSKLMGELNDDYHRASSSNIETDGDDDMSTRTSGTSNIDEDVSSSSSFIGRPTACFVYDWRRNLQELSDEFHEFCCKTFPDDQYPQVQVVAHSMGGLLALGAMRRYPDKYRPGAVLVGVPFSTGIQYLQDLQLGYTTELGRCRQFQPSSQFTMASHWSFFPRTDGVDRWEAKDEHAFVDVTDHTTAKFEANAPSIGIPVEDGFRLEPVSGTPISIDFYDIKDWEEHQIGIFDPQLQSDAHRCKRKRAAYKEHMRIQFERAKEYRDVSLRRQDNGEDIPPLVVCASDTEPTINQILRRKKPNSKEENMSSTTNEEIVYEYDYKNGRSVPGDGRIHYAGAFPPVEHDVVPLQSAHAKQFLWETEGGNLQTIMKLVDDQILAHHVNEVKVKNCEKVTKDVEEPQVAPR